MYVTYVFIVYRPVLSLYLVIIYLKHYLYACTSRPPSGRHLFNIDLMNDSYSVMILRNRSGFHYSYSWPYLILHSSYILCIISHISQVEPDHPDPRVAMALLLLSAGKVKRVLRVAAWRIKNGKPSSSFNLLNLFASFTPFTPFTLFALCYVITVMWCVVTALAMS